MQQSSTNNVTQQKEVFFLENNQSFGPFQQNHTNNDIELEKKEPFFFFDKNDKFIKKPMCQDVKGAVFEK